MPGISAGVIFTYVSYAVAAVSLLVTLTASRPSFTKQKREGTLVNSRSTDSILPLVYGKGRVGGNNAFATTTGTDNKYLHIILTLSEGEINSIVQVNSVDQIFLNGDLYTESDFKDNFTYEFFSGTSTQTVCSTLFDAYSSWVDPLRYTSYLYCRLEYDRDKFSSVPTITATLEGLKVKNFAAEDDYDLMPMVYSNNLAYCIYDLLTRPSVRGGKGMNPTRIDLPSFRDAADYYDTYGWTCNLVLNENQAIEDNLALMLSNGRSNLVYSNSKFKLKFMDTREESVCMQLTKDDIIATGKESTMKIKPAASLFSRPNAIKTTFLSADKNYHQDEKVFTDDSALATEGDYRELSIELLGLSSLESVIPMSYYYLERARWGNVVNIVVGNKGIALEPMDLVEITSVMPGWTSSTKPMYRVETTALQLEGNVSLVLLQEHDDLYNDNYDIDTQELFYTDLPKPSAIVHGVINVSHEEEVYYYRGKSFTRWNINFDPPLVSDYPFWDYAEVWVKVGDGDYKFMTTARSDYMIDPVQEGEMYYVKIRSVSIFGVKEDFNDAHVASSRIIGKTEAPSDMGALSIIAVNDTVNIYGVEVNDPDIVGYEFRIADQTITSWVGAVCLGFNRKPILSLSGMRAGSFRIFCSPQNDSNLYSDLKSYVDFDVQNPKGYTVYSGINLDYPTGSHDNTEYYDQGGGDYCIRVVHTGGLSGTWTSATIDVGEERNLRAQGDFILNVLDSSATWEAFWPTPNTWDSLDIDESWSDLYGTDCASEINATLKWGTASVSEHSSSKFELMAVDTVGRYYQVEVALTDPTYEQYILLNGSGGNTILTLTFFE